jgi:hypothetical protein
MRGINETLGDDGPMGFGEPPSEYEVKYLPMDHPMRLFLDARTAVVDHLLTQGHSAEFISYYLSITPIHVMVLKHRARE